jgi:hypothetical protein
MSFEYMYGPRKIIELPLDSTSADITVGLMLTASGATDGYFKEVDTDSEPVTGVAVSKVSSPATDGAATVKVDVSPASVYRVSPDAGNIAVTDAMNTADVGADGLTVNIDASATDDIQILSVDVDANTMAVSIVPTFSGVA